MGKLRSDVPLRAGYDRPLKPGEVPFPISTHPRQRPCSGCGAPTAYTYCGACSPSTTDAGPTTPRDIILKSRQPTIGMSRCLCDCTGCGAKSLFALCPGCEATPASDGDAAPTFALSLPDLPPFAELMERANALAKQFSEHVARDMVVTPAPVQSRAGEFAFLVTLPDGAFAGFQAEMDRLRALLLGTEPTTYDDD